MGEQGAVRASGKWSLSEWLKRGRNEGAKSKSNGGRQSKGKTQDRSKASKAIKCVSAKKKNWKRHERKTQMSWWWRVERQRYGQAEEVQASSEGEMRGVGRTRPTGKAKEKVTEESVNMKAKEEALATPHQAMSDPGEGEMAEGEQQCNEEKEEILKLLRGWQERETSPIVRWAWADESTEEESNQEEVREESGEEKKETRGMRWAYCEDGEEKEKEEQGTEGGRQEEAERKHEQEQEGDREIEAKEKKEQEKEKETRQETEQEELTSEKPPGLEQSEESEHERRKEEERRMQEAREEERRAQEAREEQERAQKALEEARAH